MRYKSLPAKGDIDSEVALLQAFNALDAAGEVAERTNDVEGLLNVSSMWLRFSQVIDGITTEESTDVVKSSPAKIEVGFSRHLNEISAEEEE